MSNHEYVLRISRADGTAGAARRVSVHNSDLRAASYLVGRMAEELFRDALYADGLWEVYNGQGRGRNYWTLE